MPGAGIGRSPAPATGRGADGGGPEVRFGGGVWGVLKRRWAERGVSARSGPVLARLGEERKYDSHKMARFEAFWRAK